VTGVGLVALDMLVFFAIYRPLGNKSAGEEQRHAELRRRVRDTQVRVDRLEKFQAALPQTGKELEDFMTDRIPARREAYSTADHLVHKVGDAAGVKILAIAFRLDTEHKDPLERLALDINAQGPYAGLLKFSHALETANEFILVRQFTFAPGEAGALSLRVGADVYLMP
jgi:Tfp pilus assembly protein PilO